MGEKKNIIMNLVELGKRNQKVTTKEINDALEEIGFEVELVDKLYEALDANNIEIVDEPDADVEEFTLTGGHCGRAGECAVRRGSQHRRPCEGVPEGDRPRAAALLRRRRSTWR